MAKTETQTEISVFIVKYLETRTDISESMKKVLKKIFGNKMYTATEWKDIVDKRLAKPAV